MAFIEYNSYVPTPNDFDKETGCNKLNDDYQNCRQVFYLKKQTELMKKSYENEQTNNSPYNYNLSTTSTTTEQLENTIKNLESKYNKLLRTNSQIIQNLPSHSLKTLFIKEIFSFQCLILLSLSIALLGYLLYSKFKK